MIAGYCFGRVPTPNLISSLMFKSEKVCIGQGLNGLITSEWEISAKY